MRDIMVIYAESRRERNLPPYDESSAADRQRFEDFRSGFVSGIGEALRQVIDSYRQPVKITLSPCPAITDWDEFAKSLFYPEKN